MTTLEIQWREGSQLSGWTVWPLTSRSDREANGKTGLGKRRVWEQEDREKLRSLSKSRKKFGPCSSSVQVSTFNRFPIWFLQEREKTKKGGRACVMLKSHQKKGENKVAWLEMGDQRRCCRRSRPSQEGGEEKKERKRGRLHGLVIESRDRRREKNEQSRIHLFSIQL